MYARSSAGTRRLSRLCCGEHDPSQCLDVILRRIIIIVSLTYPASPRSPEPRVPVCRKIDLVSYICAHQHCMNFLQHRRFQVRVCLASVAVRLPSTSSPSLQLILSPPPTSSWCSHVRIFTSLYITEAVRKDILVASPVTRWLDRERKACTFETTSVEETAVISGAIGVPLSVV